VFMLMASYLGFLPKATNSWHHEGYLTPKTLHQNTLLNYRGELT